MPLERLSPLGDEGGQPVAEPSARLPKPAEAWGITAERATAQDRKPRTTSPFQRAWPTREQREAKADKRALVREEEIAQDPVEYARQVCLELLELGPRTRVELAKALAKKGVPPEAADEVLGRFTDVGLIDDAQFASLWVSSRHRGRGLAGRALSQELRRKGIDDETVREAVAGLDPAQEEETARALVRRKLPSTRGLATEARVRRLAGMLARKGYSGGLAFRVVKEELQAEGADVPDLDTDGLSALD